MRKCVNYDLRRTSTPPCEKGSNIQLVTWKSELFVLIEDNMAYFNENKCE